MESQPEFLFADGPAPDTQPPDLRASFYEEIAALWAIPIGQLVQVVLRQPNFSDLQGRLELARAPDLPLDRRETLALRIGTIEFSSRQIIAWSLK